MYIFKLTEDYFPVTSNLHKIFNRNNKIELLLHGQCNPTNKKKT